MTSPQSLNLKTISELLSKLAGDLPDPWQSQLVTPERVEWYRHLADALGPRYRTASMENYRVYEETCEGGRLSQRRVFELVSEFCEDLPGQLRKGGGLVLFGRPGTGKDHLLAACMYWAILKHGYTVRWRDGLMLAAEIRDRVRSSENEEHLLRQLVEPQILAISDPLPPKGETSHFVTDTLQRIVDRRYRQQKSTWVTINVRDGEEAAARLAAPLVDRLRHGSLCLQCEWESFRKRGEA